MNIFYWTIFVYISASTIQPLAASNLKLSIIKQIVFLRNLEVFLIDSTIPQERSWTNNDIFLKDNDNNNQDDSNQMIFQKHRFNIGAKMARLNGDIPPLSSYYLAFDEESHSNFKNVNLLG